MPNSETSYGISGYEYHEYHMDALTGKGRYNMADILQMTYSNAFS